MNLRAPIISPMLPEQPERAPWGVFALVAVLCLALFVAACLLLVRPAAGHEAPTGWAYGIECCSSFDCTQVGENDIAETEQGYRVNLTGEVIPYSDSRIKRSKDEFYHRCTPGGRPAEPRSICLYVPDRGF